MNSQPPTLKQLLIQDLPPGFVRALLERIENIYPESHANMFNDPLLGEEQAKYALGYYRRALAETVLTNAAVEHGLNVKLIQPESGGCKHVYVSAGRFGFTICHVETSGGFPKYSDSREQSAKINEHISQIELFPVVSDQVTGGEIFNGVLVHTEKPGSKDAFKSLHIGFPTPKFDAWVDEPINLQDILNIQQRLFQRHEDIHAAIQNTTPTWKSVDVATTKEGEKK